MPSGLGPSNGPSTGPSCEANTGAADLTGAAAAGAVAGAAGGPPNILPDARTGGGREALARADGGAETKGSADEDGPPPNGFPLAMTLLVDL